MVGSARNASPGRFNGDSDALWEVSEELLGPFEKDIKFVSYFW